MKYIPKKEMDFKEPVVITGFPGMGLVGNIAAHKIAKDLNLDFVGYFDSPEVPPIMAVEEGILYPPIRVYANENMIVIYSEVLIPQKSVYELADEIMNYIGTKNPKILINLDGITSLNPKKTYMVSASENMLKSMEHENIEILDFGMAGGLAGIITVRCGDKGIPSVCLMAETNGLRPDPKGASNLITILNDMYDLDVNTEDLLKEDKEIKEKLKKLAEEQIKILSKQKIENPMYM